MEAAIGVVALFAFVAFRQWLAHHRRVMIHRERMLAIEKGVAPPPLEQEIRRNNWNVQRILLLAGLTWIAIGIAAFVTLTALLMATSSKFADDIPRGIQYVAIAPIGIGLSHLIVYLVGQNKA